MKPHPFIRDVAMSTYFLHQRIVLAVKSKVSQGHDVHFILEEDPSSCAVSLDPHGERTFLTTADLQFFESFGLSLDPDGSLRFANGDANTAQDRVQSVLDAPDSDWLRWLT